MSRKEETLTYKQNMSKTEVFHVIKAIGCPLIVFGLGIFTISNFANFGTKLICPAAGIMWFLGFFVALLMPSQRKEVLNQTLIICTVYFCTLLGFKIALALITYMKPQKTTVYTFKDNYKAGTEVTSDMLTAVQCDSKIVTAGKKTDTSSRFVTGANLKAVLNSGDSLRMDVSEGMPLTLSMLSVNGGSTVEMNMDPTKVAVTVPVTNVSGVTNDLKEGSRVNIYAMGVDTPGTTLLFQNMRVINTQKDNGTLSSATIEVDVDQSLKLVYAANYSTIYLGLVDSTGYEATDNAEPSYVPDSNNGGN